MPKTTSKIDVSGDLQVATLTPEATTMILNHAKHMFDLEMEIEKLETDLAERQEAHRKLSTETLPQLMDQYHVPALPLKAGYVLECNSVFRGNLPAESSIDKATDEDRPMLEKRRLDGLQWLKANKASEIIKNQLSINLGKGQSKLTAAVLKTLRSFVMDGQKVRLDIDQKETVHPSTLSKLLKEKHEAGVAIPLDTFAVFDGKEVKIVAPKKKKENQ